MVNKKTFIFLWLLISGIATFAQTADSLKRAKWTNFDRTRGSDDALISSDSPERYFYVTSKGDTIKRFLFKNRIGKDILEEWSYINGERNGLQITYHPNGIVAEINYYFDNKICDVISASDSSGKLLFPGSLHNATGTKIDYPFRVGQIRSTTYKNGLPEGVFYTIDRYGDDSIKGCLMYKKSAVNYIAASRCTYVSSGGDTLTDIFFKGDFSNFFGNALTAPKLLNAEADSVLQLSQEFYHLGIEFDDPAIIPTGIWTITRISDGSLKEKIVHDDNGNAIRITFFDKSGKITQDRKYPPCGKRKILKRNPDGSFYDEVYR